MCVWAVGELAIGQLTESRYDPCLPVAASGWSNEKPLNPGAGGLRKVWNMKLILKRKFFRIDDFLKTGERIPFEAFFIFGSPVWFYNKFSPEIFFL